MQAILDDVTECHKSSVKNLEQACKKLKKKKEGEKGPVIQLMRDEGRKR